MYFILSICWIHFYLYSSRDSNALLLKNLDDDDDDDGCFILWQVRMGGFVMWLALYVYGLLDKYLCPEFLSG